MTRAQDLDVVQLSGSRGAEVRGISLEKVGPAEAEQIRSLLLEHLVLFFPDQHLSADAHITFGRNFGKLEGHPNVVGSSELQVSYRNQGCHFSLRIR